MNKIIFLLAIGVFCEARAASVEFCGYVKTSAGEFLFCLRDSDTRASSPWLKLNQKWAGAQLVGFDSKSEALEVESMGDRSKLRLQAHSNKVALPSLADGNFRLADGSILYSPDAVIRVGTFKVSSKEGTMVSNQEQDMVSGDLTVETPDMTFTAKEATLRLVGGKPVMTAKVLVFPPSKATP